MSKFDNLAPRQKALLTRENIREWYLNEVLMERGVNPVLPTLVLEEMPPAPVITEREYYVVNLRHGLSHYSTTMAFTTKEDLDTFRSSNPLCMNWTGGKYEVAPVVGSEVAVRDLPDHQEAQHHHAILKAREDISKRNRVLCDEYDRLVTRIEKVETELMQEVLDAQFEGHAATQVNNTAEEYLRLCNGDEAKARVFLLKVFSEEEIERSIAWFKQPASILWGQ